MIQENVNFEFKDFDPDYKIQTFIAATAEKLHATSPSDAAINVAIQNVEGAIEASCKIVSQVGTFGADAVSTSPIQAIEQLERKIRDQLDTWKARRFQNFAV